MKNALIAPISGAERERDRDRDGDGDAVLDVEDRDHHRRERQRARNRQVEIARGQRDDQAKGQNDDDRIEAQHRRIRRPGEHGWSHEAEPDDQDGPGGQKAEFFRRRREVETCAVLPGSTNWLSIAFSLASSAAMRSSYARTASWSTSLMRSSDPRHRMVAAFGDRFLVQLRARQLHH